MAKHLWQVLGLYVIRICSNQISSGNRMDPAALVLIAHKHSQGMKEEAG
jgi:hypothetical protein